MRERAGGSLSGCGQSRREGWDRLTGQLPAISLHDRDVFLIFSVEGVVIWGDCHEPSATRACIEDEQRSRGNGWLGEDREGVSGSQRVFYVLTRCRVVLGNRLAA